MKIHPHWNTFALGLQVAGWNHGEWIALLALAYKDEDPFVFPVSKMILATNGEAKLELWSQKWVTFLAENSWDTWKNHADVWQEWAKEHGWFWYVPWDEKYPSIFKEEEDYPLVVWCSAELVERKGHTRVGVVGSREASAYGMFACASLVKDLVKKYQCDIVSGCARGIDMSAHKQALRSGGYTYGFVACGAARIPSWLVQTFAKGCLVSIFSPHIFAQKWHFAQRNIYLSRWSQGVLVVEAAPKSGTLLTAHSALEHGRPLAVVTHPIFAPNWKGIRSLIELGAEIVSSAQECMEAFGLRDENSSLSQTLYDELHAATNNEEEFAVVSFLLEQGGSAFEQDFPEVLQNQKVLSHLAERGVIVKQAGVVLLSCMIQS